MKFQLILSASALLLSTGPAALAGATQYQYGEDIHGQGGSSGSGSSRDGTLLEGDGDSDVSRFSDMLPNLLPLEPPNNDYTTGTFDPDLAAFSDMFVATPRGRNNNNVRDTAAFRNGRQVGIRQAEQTWQRLGGTCRTAWRSYPNAINRIIQRLQRAQRTPRNQGRIAGLRQELQRRRRECNGRNPNPPRPNPRNPQVCIRFGNEAARRIAWDHCNTWPLRSNQNQSWRQECRDVAINTCRGQVATEVQNQCGLPSTRTLRQLQNKCSGQVDSMIRNSRRFTEEEMMLS